MLNSYEGIVLKSINYSESDKIVHIFTKEIGKISCIAKGVRKSKKRDVNVDLFTHSYFQIYKGRGLYGVNQSERIDSNFEIRENIEKLSYASLVAEIADCGLPEEEDNEKVFELLAKTLKLFGEGSVDPRRLLVSYELKFISFIGYKPELKRCAGCGSEELSNICRFSNDSGGVLCDSCRGIDKYSKHISNSEHRAMYMLLYSRYEELNELELDEKELSKVQEIVHSYIKHHMERSNFKSLELLRELKLI